MSNNGRLKKCTLHKEVAPSAVDSKSHLWWFCHLSPTHSSPLCLHHLGLSGNGFSLDYMECCVLICWDLCVWVGCWHLQLWLCALQVAVNNRVTDKGRRSSLHEKVCNRWQIFAIFLFWTGESWETQIAWRTNAVSSHAVYHTQTCIWRKPHQQNTSEPP